MKIFEETKSVCPKCLKDIDAQIVEDNGSVYMEKNCAEHGPFKTLISKYSWYYKGLNQFYNMLSPQGHPFEENIIENFQIFPITKCNLSCKICYSASDSIGETIPIEKIESMIKSIKKAHRRISILGGEPTLREDLSGIIKIIRKYGHDMLLFTHGLRFLDVEYLRKLKKSGLRHVGVWVDSLRDDTVYEKIRGASLLDKKNQVLQNLKTADMATRLVMVLVRGINEKDIQDLADFSRGNKFVHALNIRSYSTLGRKEFSEAEEFCMDELVEVVSRQTKGLVNLDEFFLFQKMVYIIKLLFVNQPVCWQDQSIYIPRQKSKKIRDVFVPRNFGLHLNEFEKIYKDSPGAAKKYFLKKMFKVVVQNPVFSYWLGASKLFRNRSQYIELSFLRFYTPYTYDYNQISRRCRECWLDSYIAGKPVDFCSYLVKFSNSSGGRDSI